MNEKQTTPEEETRYAELQQIALDAARMGETSTLEPMLRAGMPANLADAKGNTLIMLAAYHDHPDTVECLAYYGAEVDRRNGRGQTPLAGVAFKGHMDCARILVHYGADPEAPQGHGQTPVSFAAMFGRKQMLVYLQSVGKHHPVKNAFLRAGATLTRVMRKLVSRLFEARERKRLRWAVHY
ncbi:ankyrin repeat domain-containing protein [Verrucomicrobiaceae bacterium N1E253]|uniref:Ankyrin repeat domain-containing protein n=1 Tax=Oceaniferula marina TaxID=2748318 RepID=A0A851GIX5_9BACT|nr:ankyrin repeat domain-containing protein [Oceaniferula marina]NWK54600.1 ankyrin repeat domain-containing protein [Oceaniferula marina]